MAYDIGPKIGIDGEAEYRQKIKNINEGLKTLGSEMKVVTSSFLGQEKSMESLSAENEVLTKQSDALKDKLAEQNKMLEAAKESYAADSDEVLKWQRAVNNTTAELNKTNAQIEQNAKSMDELGSETEDTGKQMDDASGSASRFGDNLKANLASEAIVAGVKALANAVKETVKALAGAVTESAYWADDLNTMAKTTGISTEQLQKYQFAAEQVDVSVDTIAGSMAKLTKNMSTARGGTGAAAEAFAQLGITITDTNGELRSNDDVFQETIAALGKIENETERDAAAMAIFGKSAQDLNPLILGGAETLQELGKQAEEAGLILGQDSLDQLNLVSDALDTFKATSGAAGKLFMVGFAQPISDAINTLTGYVQRLTSAFSTGGFSGLAAEASAVLDEILTGVNAMLPEIFTKGTELLLNLVQGMVERLPDLLDLAGQLVITLATGIGNALPELVPAAVDAVITLADNLVDNIDLMVDSAITLITGLADGIISALPVLLEKAPTIIIKLVTAIAENIPKLLQSAAEIIGQLVIGIINSLPEIGRAAGEIIAALGAGLAELWANLIEVGGNIVMGVWEGIKNMGEWLKEKVMGFFTSIVDGVKSVLGIASPSKVFAEIGKYSAEGIRVGWDKTLPGVRADMLSSIGNITDGMAASMPVISGSIGAAGASVYSSGMVGSMGDVVINLTSMLDGQVLARNQYRYNAAEITRHGPSLVTG